MVVGVVAAVALVALILGAFAGLVVPLVISTVLGVLLHPVIDSLERAGCSRGVGAGLVLLGLLAVAVASVWMTVVGLLEQESEISQQVTSAIKYLDQRIGTEWDPIGDPDTAAGGIADALPQVFGGLSRSFGSVFSGFAAFVLGSGIAAFFLYYVLRDWPLLYTWLSRHLGVDPELGRSIIDSANNSIRSYFGAITISSVATVAVIGLTALVLGMPLVFSIVLVTFVTSYIPYIGAFFSGAFAVLIALGSVGVSGAIAMLIVILIAQNLVQTMLITKLSSDALRIHPIVNLGSTIAGGVIAGLLGAMLSVPVVAIVIMMRQKLAQPVAIGEDEDAVDQVGG
jgi:predicted PurR-regulated permease PerM